MFHLLKKRITAVRYENKRRKRRGKEKIVIIAMNTNHTPNEQADMAPYTKSINIYIYIYKEVTHTHTATIMS